MASKRLVGINIAKIFLPCIAVNIFEVNVHLFGRSYTIKVVLDYHKSGSKVINGNLNIHVGRCVLS